MDDNKGKFNVNSDPRRTRVRDPKQVEKNMVTGYKKDNKTIRKARYTLNKNLHDAILDKIADGLPIKIACGLCGVPASKYSEWKKLGMSQLSGKYRKFLEGAEIAEAEAQYSRVMTIKAAAEGTIKLKEVKRVVQPKKIRVGDDGDHVFEMQMVEETTTTKQVAPSWQAAAWHLERTNYDIWGRPMGT
ncbi:hypothetical protein KAU11_12150, partial [Candidatus Babeliales bacterium]|nr:hypothetical protein [Candidatus Babeliales bacterium]